MDKEQVVRDLKISSGKHASIDNGACVMELVSYLANEPWSDHPSCVCPVLTAYAIPLNDRGDAEMRVRLKELAPQLVGTSGGNGKARAELLVLRAITVLLPILTDALDLKEISARLRRFKAGEWVEARAFIKESELIILERARKRPSVFSSAHVYKGVTSVAFAASSASFEIDATAATHVFAAASAIGYAVVSSRVRQEVFEEAFKSLEQAINID